MVVGGGGGSGSTGNGNGAGGAGGLVYISNYAATGGQAYTYTVGGGGAGVTSSPNDASTSNGTFNLLSPTLSIAELGDGETMNFGFHLKCDTPDVDGDGELNIIDVVIFINMILNP